MPSFLAAAVQMHAGPDRAANLETAARLVETAAGRGAKLVVLPEFFQFYGHLQEIVAGAETIPGPTSTALAALAARHKITFVAGTICEQAATVGLGHNTCLVFDETGRQIATYRKRHLFDVNLPNRVSVCESSLIVPGDEIVAFDALGVRIGLATCYDVRFPEHFRKLVDAGMQVLSFPSAFSAPTGEAHWEVLLRARAIENQAYVVAANQYGQHTRGLATWGHSLIVDPWGRILAEASSDRDEVIVAEIDPAAQEEIRKQVPCLQHRRK